VLVPNDHQDHSFPESVFISQLGRLVDVGLIVLVVYDQRTHLKAGKGRLCFSGVVTHTKCSMESTKQRQESLLFRLLPIV